MKAVSLWLVLLGALSGSSWAGGHRDLGDAWLIPDQRLVGMLAPGQSSSAWWMQVAQGRLFGMPELPQLGLQMGRNHPRWRLAVGWERLGSELYREDSWQLDFMVGGRQSLGFRLGEHRLIIGGDPAHRNPALAILAELELPAGTKLAAWIHLDEAPAWHGTGLRRWFCLDGGRQAWAWALGLDRANEGPLILQGAVSLQLVPGMALGVRVEPWSGTAGLTTAWRLKGLLLRSSHLIHPVLGPSHRWSLTAGGRS